MEKKGPRAQHLASRPSQPPDHEEQPPPRSPAPPRFPAAESPGEGFTHQSRLWGLDTAENPVPAGWGRGKKENRKLTESTGGDGVLRILGGAQVTSRAQLHACCACGGGMPPRQPGPKSQGQLYRCKPTAGAASSGLESSVLTPGPGGAPLSFDFQGEDAARWSSPHCPALARLLLVPVPVPFGGCCQNHADRGDAGIFPLKKK